MPMLKKYIDQSEARDAVSMYGNASLEAKYWVLGPGGGSGAGEVTLRLSLLERDTSHGMTSG